MDREEMRMAILKQEQTFRQQVQELHRLYHVQKQLMTEVQVAGAAAGPCRAHATTVDTKPFIQRNDHAAVHQLPFSFSDYKAPASASADECNLELTLATGCGNSSSRGHKGKGVKSASNSDSGGTALSSTSTDSELAQFREPDAPTVVRFQRLAGAGAGELGQQPQWTHQRLSLRMA